MKLEFTEHAQTALIRQERPPAVCSFCGAQLPTDYYLLLSAWRSEEKELVTPVMRFCPACWERIEHTAYKALRQLQLSLQGQRQ